MADPTESDRRPLSTRLDAYIANLRSLASQMSNIRVQASIVPGVDAAALEELDRTVKLYGLIADDLTKVLNGEKLQEFRIEGTIDNA